MDFTDLGSAMQISDLRKDVEKLKVSEAKAARIEEVFRKIEFLYEREMKRAAVSEGEETFEFEQLGDRGQRYEIRYRNEGDPSTFSKIVGWSDDFQRALDMARFWKRHPGVLNAWVIDRVYQAWKP